MPGSFEMSPTPVPRPRIRSAPMLWAAIPYPACSTARAFPAAPRGAKPPSAFLRAILDFCPLVHFDRGELEHFGAWGDGTDAVVGKSVAWLRRFFRARRKSMAARAAHSPRYCRHVFSTGSAVAGGHTVMRHAWALLALSFVLCRPAVVRAESAGPSGGGLHFCLCGETQNFYPLLFE